MLDIDTLIRNTLRKQDSEEKARHEPSGKLSAGMLYKPLLEQVLKLVGVPERPSDDYSLRLFARGRQVEDWVLSMLEGPEQVECNYRGAIGFLDKLRNGEVVEVKSIKRSQVRWLKKEGAKWSHKLQAGMYALSLDKPEYTIVYACADDFETFTFTEPTSEIQPDIDRIITEVAKQLKSGELPEFIGREDYHNTPDYASKYSAFPDWVVLDQATAMEKLKNQYPDAYAKLTKEQASV